MPTKEIEEFYKRELNTENEARYRLGISSEGIKFYSWRSR